MAKGSHGKSSATSATRKKHAAKKGAATDDDQQTQPTKKQKKKEPKVKVYIPPSKPLPISPDPLETTGLVHRLPPELVVVLRCFGKKAAVTKVKALEDLLGGWVRDDNGLVLVDMMPVWTHHLPGLLVHPSRRVRSLATSVNYAFTQSTPTRDALMSFLSSSGLGTCALSTHDIDRSTATMAKKAWDAFVSYHPSDDHLVLDINSDSFTALLTFLSRSILDPAGVWAQLNPAQPSLPQPHAGGLKKGPPIRQDPAETPRSKAEEVDEQEQDRNARIRVEALGVLRDIITDLLQPLSVPPTGSLLDLLKNPVLWTALFHGQRSPVTPHPHPDTDAFGFAQPNVRKAAWALAGSIQERIVLAASGGSTNGTETETTTNDTHDALIRVLAPAMLRSAWVEPDTNVFAVLWPVVLRWVGRCVGVWGVEWNYPYDDDDGAEDVKHIDGDEHADADADGAGYTAAESAAPSTKQKSRAYEEFLRFLEEGCNGNPIAGYPGVVVVLMSLDMDVFLASSTHPLSTLFDAFWGAKDSRALSGLQRRKAGERFLEALGEAVVGVVRRVVGKERDGEDVGKVVEEQIERIWENVVREETVQVDVNGEGVGRVLGRMVLGLMKVGSGNVADAAYDLTVKKIEQFVDEKPETVLGLVKVLRRTLEQGAGAGDDADLQARAQRYVGGVDESLRRVRGRAGMEFEASVSAGDKDEAREGEGKGNGKVLEQLMRVFGADLFMDEEVREILDRVFKQYALQVMIRSPEMYLGYLRSRGDEAVVLGAWRGLLGGVAGISTSDLAADSKVERAVGALVKALDAGWVPRYLRPLEGRGEVDELVQRLVVEVINGDGECKYAGMVEGVVRHADQFLSGIGYAEVVKIVCMSLSARVQAALVGGSGQEVSEGLDKAMVIFLTMVGHPTTVLPLSDFTTVLPDVFAYGYLLPEAYGDFVKKELVKEAKEVVTKMLVEDKDGLGVRSVVLDRLRALVGDTKSRMTPRNIFSLFTDGSIDIATDLVSDLFPSPETFDQWLDALPAEPLHPSLAVDFPLIPPHSSPKSSEHRAFDSRGFSPYARVVEGLLQLFVEQRRLAKQHVWALRHFHALRIYAQDLVSVSVEAEKSIVFEVGLGGADELEGIVKRVDQITAYVLNSETDERWYQGALGMLVPVTGASKTRAQAQPLGMLAAFLVVVVNVARQGDRPRDVRVLRNILQHVFQDISKEDADEWVGFARRVESSAPYTSMAIVSTIAEYAPEPPKLDWYRNELAASLLAIRPSKANTEGLLALLKLSSSAPDPESDVVFLPQPRAVNVMKACQQWITSDEDIDEELESAMTLIAFHLAPLLQDVPGAHWDLIFDLIENNLEAASLTDDDTLVTLAETLRLTVVVQDLAATNKSLRAEWEPRKGSILKMIKGLATVPLSGLGRSRPRSTCRELILSIVQQLPASLIDYETLPKMSHLITDPSTDVQKIAYQFLKRAAKQATEHAVIEASVDSEAQLSPQIPQEVIEILQRFIEVSEASSDSIFSYLLGWMLLFDLFQDASLKVRTSYIDQLRNLDLFVLRFIPTIIHLLSLDQGPLKSFKLSLWSVDEYHVEYFDPALDFSIPVFAAHLYYRALLTVPSLISAWVLELKDRQLSSSISTYTSQNFSPVLVRAELDNVKSPDSMAQFADASDPDKSLKVKVASNVNEVSAAYVVDEHQLEIRLKIPTDWPLHRIEVRDAKRVGVDEQRWRAWLLAVQQIIWSQNGRIVDGLCHFKNNVTGHFEGQVECAICYSIISVMDGTLPKKPCRTCKNRFHAGCLYKWFNTSHSSSCPLCRSDIF